MILMSDRFIIWFLVSELSVERIKFGFLKDYAIRGSRSPTKNQVPSQHIYSMPSQPFYETWMCIYDVMSSNYMLSFKSLRVLSNKPPLKYAIIKTLSHLYTQSISEST